VKYVIVGGDAAGMSAAMQIVRKGTNPEITVFEQGEYYSYAQCGLPYLLTGEVSSAESLVARSQAEFQERYGIDARTLHRVEAVDFENRLVCGTQLDEGQPFEESYDQLLIASGARPRMPNWPGISLDGVRVLKTIPDAEALQREAGRVQHVVVIGAGYVGLEAAESFVHMGKDVRIINRSGRLGGTFDDDMAPYILEEAQRNGIAVSLNEQVQELEGEQRVSAVTTDQGRYRADLVLVCVGVTPNTEFAAGLACHESGAVLVDPHLRTSEAGVFAAGDCASQYHRLKRRPDYMPLGTTANKQGMLAGLNLIGRRQPFQGVVGTGVLRFFDLTLARTGLNSREAEAEGLPWDAVVIESRQMAGYMPGAGRLAVKLVYEKETHRLLGGQLIGPGADKRVDVLATALYSELSTDELLHLDLAYAPPYNGVWDPIQQAARRIR